MVNVNPESFCVFQIEGPQWSQQTFATGADRRRTRLTAPTPRRSTATLAAPLRPASSSAWGRSAWAPTWRWWPWFWPSGSYGGEFTNLLIQLLMRFAPNEMQFGEKNVGALLPWVLMMMSLKWHKKCAKVPWLRSNDHFVNKYYVTWKFSPTCAQPVTLSCGSDLLELSATVSMPMKNLRPLKY